MDADAEQVHRSGVEDTKFWSQCLVCRVHPHHGVGAPRQKNLLADELKFHFCHAVSDIISFIKSGANIAEL